jgi:hypothetical protein
MELIDVTLDTKLCMYVQWKHIMGEPFFITFHPKKMMFNKYDLGI